MKIVDLQVIPFRVPRRDFRNGQMQPEVEVIQVAHIDVPFLSGPLLAAVRPWDAPELRGRPPRD